MITLTPLTPPPSASSTVPLADQPICYLLQVDDVKVLLDVGGYDPRRSSIAESYEYEEKIRSLAPEISLVLLSHSPSTYLSLFPYARAHWGLKCPVYATQPTVEMGRVVCLEEAQDWRAEVAVSVDAGKPVTGVRLQVENVMEGIVNAENKEEPQEGDDKEEGKHALVPPPLKGPFVCTVEEINEAFNSVKSVRYSQPIVLSGILSHLLLTPYSSGHTLGGTVFKIRSPTSGTILYAVGMNHTQERHLDGTVILNPDLITSTLTNNQSLLFPIDASPRLLELLVLLDQHWSFSISREAETRTRWTYPLCLVSRTAEEMLVFARSLMEWMGGAVARAQEEGLAAAAAGGGQGGRRGGRAKEVRSPLLFRHLKFFPTYDAFLHAFPETDTSPKLILAVPLSMSYGPSRRLFTRMAVQENATVVLTSRAEDQTLTNDMFRIWNDRQSPAAQYGGGAVGSPTRVEGEHRVVQVDRKVLLEGDELQAFLDAERHAREKQLAYKAAQERSRRMLEADDLEDSDSDDDDDDDADQPEEGEGNGAGMDQDEKAGQVALSGVPGASTMGAGAGALMETDDFRTASFDIYVKGQQMRTTSFFGAGPNAAVGGGSGATRFRMFPFVERKMRKVDVYGEQLDVGAWIRKGREIEEEVESPEVREAKRRKKEEEEKQKEPPEPPSKYITEEVTVDVRCSIFYVDMEGLHDGRAIKTMIPSLNPRRVIIVGSLPEASKDLVKNCESVTALTKEIYVPLVNETMSIGEQTQSHSISLSEGLLSSLSSQWAKFEDYEIARISGRITSGVNSAIPVLDLPYKAYQLELDETAAQAGDEQDANAEGAYLQHTADGEGDGQEMKPVLPVTTSTGTSAGPSQTSILFTTTSASLMQEDPRPVLPQSIYIGDLRLTALKTTLNGLGIPVEFAGEGTLICGPGVPELVQKYQEASEKGQPTENIATDADIGEIVVIRKSTEGTLQLEGGVTNGEVYYQVRKALYGSFAEVIV
ncbi:hypothetical protein QFC22_003395 [Naganishia vaughanmartiniae]|uniref:Uncharacterized protein n=1 Tax=Naganishia vaughanmartiniae TaxID=1424756 RepID=A0ACC2X8H6_9TREE|nr:hypothetical protein QFC22_003395 [Naganishia vaughanmartiniae]